MKLTSFVLLVVIASCYQLRVQAQENFQPGFVVGVNGDTLRGRIDYRDWVANPKRVVFLDGAGKRTEYAEGSMTAFGVHDEVYRSYTVTVYPYSQDPAVVTASNWSGQPYDTKLFLRLVTTGRLSLWGYHDSTNVVYFFIQKGAQAPVQLRIQNRVVVHNAASDVITDDVYKFQLSDYVSACSRIADKPVPVAYEENALKNLIDIYNHCGAAPDEGGGKRRGVTVGLLVYGGGIRSAVKPEGKSNATYAHWPAYLGPTGGVGVWIEPAKGTKARKWWGLVIDALYDDLMVNSGIFHANYYQIYTGKLDYMEVKGNIQLRYAYTIGDWRPFLGIGFSNSLIFSNNSSQKLFDQNDNSTIRQPLFGSGVNLATYRPGGFGVVGVAWKRWSLEGRYERTADLVNTTTGIKAPVTNFYALAAFRF